MKRLSVVILFILFYVPFLAADIGVTPYGGAGTVSGSCFLVETGSSSVIVDCGIFMDNEEERGFANRKNTQMDDKLINAGAMVLTHAHIDHSGRIPLLIHKGFKGKIYSTEATKELALAMFKNRNGFDLIEREWFWSESQKLKAKDRHSTPVIHWTDFCRRNIKAVEYSEGKMTLAEVEEKQGVEFMLCRNCCEISAEALEHFFVSVKYAEETELPGGIKFKFIDAAHVPGSASVILYAGGKTVLFSGDIGSGYSRLNGMFDIPEKADMIFMEATYAGENARFDMAAYEIFQNDLMKALEKGKTVWIPSLSFNRTQKVLFELKLMFDSGKLNKSIPIYSISSSANALTALYQREAAKGGGEWFSEEIYKAKSVIPRNAKLQMIRSCDKQMILISSSGDMDMGRSRQLVPVLVPGKDVFIMIVSYVSPSSNAGKLLSGKKLSREIKSGASVKKYDIFSDHPDFSMLEKWLSKQDKNADIYLIHSEEKNIPKVLKLMRKNGWTNVKGAAVGEKALLRK